MLDIVESSFKRGSLGIARHTAPPEATQGQVTTGGKRVKRSLACIGEMHLLHLSPY